ncbi:LasR-specific antiactivator QslA [Pseudomonas citronellolis]|uniref:LasR-specific antiactivator QslA n=2 Tax=Pseudomonas citronellolis TaxID=53408 RepID=UPI001875A38D|nr:LasR-specific antiactivator QslA [Pseudomonas citronellolis]
MDMHRPAFTRAHHPTGKLFTTHIPAADGQPALELFWLQDCQAAIDAGQRRAERWLIEKEPASLWAVLLVGREGQVPEGQRTAYEVAFLARLQQRLLAQDAST